MESECYKSGRSNGLHLREECIVLLSTDIACSPSFQIEIVCVKCCSWVGVDVRVAGRSALLNGDGIASPIVHAVPATVCCPSRRQYGKDDITGSWENALAFHLTSPGPLCVPQIKIFI